MEVVEKPGDFQTNRVATTAYQTRVGGICNREADDMKLNILLVSDQVRGIDGTGGLGDVATGLARELAEREDNAIRCVMPGYEQISEKGHEHRFDDVVFDDLAVPWGIGTRQVIVSRYHLPRFKENEDPVVCYLLRDREVFARRENSAAQAVLLARATLALV
ncbi:MAG: glycogen/starch synthase, partial [Planctomycetaceae bacterium]|nr:glycogen/starch synthase [Planctomycetaceae bacterium]